MEVKQPPMESISPRQVRDKPRIRGLRRVPRQIRFVSVPQIPSYSILSSPQFHGGLRMLALSNRSVLVIETLIQGSVAWRSPAGLARRLGWTLDETNDILCDLDLAGWIVTRDIETGILVTLSPRAAAQWKGPKTMQGSERIPMPRLTRQPEPLHSRTRRIPNTVQMSQSPFSPEG